MQTRIVWTTQPVNDHALRRFAEAYGGYWNDVVGDEVVIERGVARVFVSSALADDETNVMPDDVARVASRIGQVPASMVSFRIGHANGSTRLAEDLATRAVKEWGGFWDRNEP